MGAVYHAWDTVLEVAVALKVIRIEAIADPHAAADLERRFKNELLLARKVTHKNVVRIHDFGEVDGIKYITMPYVEGQDLSAILAASGRLPVSKALAIAKQVAGGLEAAHEVGVVHRDLKPANIMIDGDRALIMDFGIARSTSNDAETILSGGTMAGAVIGTLQYMAPEQGRGEAVDQRADIYAFGLILSDMLVGRRQAAGTGTFMTELLRRMQSAPPSPRTIDPTIPEGIDHVISRCVQPDPAARYQTSAELCADLNLLDADGNARTSLSPPTVTTSSPAVGRASTWWTRVERATGPVPVVARRPASRKWIAAAVVVVVGVAAILVRQRMQVTRTATPAAGPPPISLAILPLRNASADKSIDWLGPSLAEMLRTEIGQSAHLRSISSDRLDQILRDLHIAADSALDPSTIRRLAEFSNADTILWGQFAKLGDAIRIDATIDDIKRQRMLTLKAEAANQSGLFTAMAQLAQSVRESLALSPDIVKELQEKSFKPSTQSLEALRFYNQGVQLARQGKHADALKAFQTSTEADRKFALAYSRLGQSHANLGYDNEAEQFSRKAVELAGSLPPQEKYLILANHARIQNDNAKAIESYENLAKVSPDDPDVHFNLASLYETVGSLDQARDHYGRVLKDDPNYVDALFSYGRVEIKRGNAQGSLQYLNRAHNLAIQLENEEAKANVLNAIGVAYKVLRKPDEALRYYRQSLEIKRRIADKRGIAVTLGEIAQIEGSLGKADEALASYREALQLQRDIGDKKGLGGTLINLGLFYTDRADLDGALKMFKDSLQIQRDVGNESLQALCLNNIGNVYLAKGEYEDALLYFERALELREKAKVPTDVADTRHNLAETFANLGRYDQALAEYLRALELYRNAGDKRGAAIEAYSMGTVFAYQGRYGAALKSKEEALTAFRALQERSFWLSEILGGYGNALVQMGRGDQAEKTFDEALAVARELGNPGLIAQTLGFQGDSAWYRGDFKAARGLFDQALKQASRTTDRRLLLIARVNVAKVAVQEQRPPVKERESQALVQTLTGLTQESDALGLKYVSVECSTHLAQALLNRGEHERARQEIERAVSQSEKLGLRGLLARSRYLAANLLRLTGNQPDASIQAREAKNLLDEIRKEAGSDDLLKRSDLGPISAP
jgi:tetratricopeptide (TPR) repeat protein